MSYRGVLDDLQKCSAGQHPSRVPLFVLGEEFNMRMAGMTYRQYRLDLDKSVRMICDTVEEFGYDWALVFPDDYVEWEPFGLEMLDEEDLPTAATKYLPATRQTVREMVFPDLHRDGRMPIHLETLHRVKDELGDSTCVAGRVAAPFSAVGLLFGVESLMLAPYDDPNFLEEAIAKALEFTVLWGKAQRDAGADVLWVGDCLAASVFISPEFYARYAAPAAKKAIRALKETDLFLIYHASEYSPAHIKLEAEYPPMP